MAVYTKLINKDILSLSKDYQIDKVIKFTGIKKGIENTNYLLRTKKKKFILTIFEKRVKKKRSAFFYKFNGQVKSKKKLFVQNL